MLEYVCFCSLLLPPPFQSIVILCQSCSILAGVFPLFSLKSIFGFIGLSPAYLSNLIYSFLSSLCSVILPLLPVPSSSSIPNPLPSLSLCKWFCLCLHCSCLHLADLFIFILQVPAQMLFPWRDLPRPLIWSGFPQWLSHHLVYFLHRAYHCFWLSAILRMNCFFIDLFVWPSPTLFSNINSWVKGLSLFWCSLLVNILVT